MSIFGSDYQRGFNAARGRQVSEQICAGLSAGLNRRREQDRAQQQHAAQQGLIQAMQLQILQLQQENARLRQDNAEYERFTNRAINTIDERNLQITDLQRRVQGWIDFAFR